MCGHMGALASGGPGKRPCIVKKIVLQEKVERKKRGKIDKGKEKHNTQKRKRAFISRGPGIFILFLVLGSCR